MGKRQKRERAKGQKLKKSMDKAFFERFDVPLKPRPPKKSKK